MTFLIKGAQSFLSTFLLVFIIAELNIFFETVIERKFELRKGMFKKHLTQTFLMFTNKEPLSERILKGISVFPAFLAAAMLPNLHGDLFFAPPHAFWIFILVMTLSPVIEFFLQLFSNKMSDDFLEVRLQEKSMAGFALLLISMIGFTLLVAKDDVASVIELQKRAGWLVAQKPATTLIFIALVIVVYYVCQQKIFSKSHNRIAEKESEERKFYLEVWKAVWLIFLTVVFLGGGSAVAVIFKAFIINTIAIFIFEGTARLREDQAESIIIWEMTPFVLFLALITLLFVGWGL